MLFMDPVFFLWLIPLAIALDMRFGDPQDLPLMHPARRIRRFLELLEPEARKLGDTRAVGVLCALTTAGLTGAVVWLLTGVLPGLWAAFSLYFAYSGLGFGCLLHTGAAALDLLEHGGLPEAQAIVGQMANCDATAQDRPALYASLAESLSKNMTDAVIGPLFWLMLTGPVGLWIYKAVNTIGSVWTYKTPRWKSLGWAGARLDQALAFAPARLGAFFLYLAARLQGNAAIKHKPLMEPQGAAWDAQRVRCLMRQTRLAGLLAAGFFYLAALAFFCGAHFFSTASRLAFFAPMR